MSHTMASTTDGSEKTLVSRFPQTWELRSETAAWKSLRGLATLRPTTVSQVASVLAAQGKMAVFEGLCNVDVTRGTAVAHLAAIAPRSGTDHTMTHVQNVTFHAPHGTKAYVIKSPDGRRKAAF